MRLFASLAVLAILLPLSALAQDIPPRVVIGSPDIEYTWSNPNASSGSKLPGFIDWPVLLKTPRFQDEPLECNELDLWASMSIVKQYIGHAHQQHLVGEEFYLKPTIWLREGLRPRSGVEEFFGSRRLGAIWSVERPPAPAGGQGGFGWVHMRVQKLPTSGNLLDERNWNIPADGVVAFVRVRTPMYPGVWLLNTNAARSRTEKTYLRKFSFQGPQELELIHDPGYLVIHPPPEWKQAGYSLDPLFNIRPVDPDNPQIEPTTVTVEDLLNRQRAWDQPNPED